MSEVRIGFRAGHITIADSDDSGFCGTQRMGGVDGRPPRRHRRGLATDRKKGIYSAVGLVRRGARGRAVLRMDRRTEAWRERSDLSAVVRAAREEEHLVQGESREGAGDDR